MKDQKIELPPLPIIPVAVTPWKHSEATVVKLLQDYARAAIEPYAKRIAGMEAEAQELLEALGDLKTELVLSDVEQEYIESHFRPSLNKAEAAIAKAMGDRLGQLAAESAIEADRAAKEE